MSKASRLRLRKKRKNMFFVVSEVPDTLGGKPFRSYLRKDGLWRPHVVPLTLRFRKKRAAETVLASAILKDPTLIGKAWVTPRE